MAACLNNRKKNKKKNIRSPPQIHLNANTVRTQLYRSELFLSTCLSLQVCGVLGILQNRDHTKSPHRRAKTVMYVRPRRQNTIFRTQPAIARKVYRDVFGWWDLLVVRGSAKRTAFAVDAWGWKCCVDALTNDSALRGLLSIVLHFAEASSPS